MKKIPILLLLLSSLSFGSQAATKDDIKDLIQHMDKRFEQVDKRFEQVDKRFEQIQNSMDKRFEQVDKRFEQIQNSMDKRFEQIQNSMDKRFEDMMGFLFLLASGVFGLMAIVVWDRRTMLTQTKKEMKEEITVHLDEKVDKNIVKHIVEALRELGKKDKEFDNILTKHHLNSN